MIPAILANEERLRQFKLAHPDWQYLASERLNECFAEFCKTYNDGWTRLQVPDYWNPAHFQTGQKVVYGEFQATIIRHYYHGMWEIRVPGGMACVSGADLKTPCT